MKHIIHIILNVIEKVGPTIATLSAVYLAYRYAKKQKSIENKSEEYKKVRTVTSNLLQIWRELSYMEFYSSSEDFMAELIFKNQKIASNYFGIDIRRVKKFKRLFHESKEEIKSINVSLFYALEHSFMEFNKTFNNFDSSGNVKKSTEKDFKEILENILKSLVREIEGIIVDTSQYLPEIEKKEIEKIIQRHHGVLEKTDFDYEVPKFLLDTINKLIPVIEPITEEEIKIFISDSTIKMFLVKAAPIIIEMFLRENPIQALQEAFVMIKNPQSFEGKINEDDLFMQINISEQENLMFQDNKVFYKMMCALYKKFDLKVPFSFRRFLNKLNKGDVNIKRELDMHKAKIVLTRASVK